MGSGERTLLSEVSDAYQRARRNYEQHQARGNAEMADAALSKMQTIESSIQIRELNSAWRNDPLGRTEGECRHEGNCRG